MSTDAPVKYKYVKPIYETDNVSMFLQRLVRRGKYPDGVRIGLVGPRGAFRGGTSVVGQELVDALAEMGFRASEQGEADDA